MRPLRRYAFFSILLLGIALNVALAQTTQKQGTGSITGQIMLRDKGMANVTMILYPIERTPERAPVARATTDYEGRYRLTGVPSRSLHPGRGCACDGRAERRHVRRHG